ncbi:MULTISPECIES: aminotransferase class V-fold PLP-dependent enzyme [unclassified Curtobacterium]|uniref:aminotransferase class V-fold PLP-dependent enzyme n=1 Tax=unclassified Curtobacterium TaxID=257496 RepID=UPI000F47AEA5|nr:MULTISPECIES: aminotransferase class V-fold PLP-dependent enzyme [unclassified Curtobacterium]ROQ17317.1 selenocysteine lyase/cysteine desulfurase [Curtobacterium sp. PhB171]ROQ29438.1 selenocysteine lyase/cysteine desulfurase [Curtobacterium sp. PhB170]ROS45416.1 selenocysteine lyase/cysteine desulfurase [Curtobacterium sp. PhB131]ROS65876.1 selenocysteine lyase/cysteine desulfurase [Curtobacterium sp. PhB141]
MNIDEYAAGFSEDPGYLDHAAFGPVQTAVLEEQRVLGTIQEHMRFGAMETLDEQDARVRTVAARLVGRREDQVVSQTATTPGLLHTAFGLTGGVLVSADEYPSLPLALASAASATGGRVQPVVIESGAGWMTPSLIQERLTDDVTAVAVSLVDWRTGYLADLAGIREVIGDRLLILDAIQGFGVVDAPYEIADVVATGGQKWLHAGWGTGFTAFSDRALNRLRPALSGPHGTTGWPVDVPAVRPGAAGYQMTRIDPIAQARLAVSLDRLTAVGVAAVQERVTERVERVFAIADEFGLEVESSRDPRERAGIVVLRPAEGRLTALSAALHNHGVTATTRLGVARVSVFASTTDETLDMFRDACVSYATLR